MTMFETDRDHGDESDARLDTADVDPGVFVYNELFSRIEVLENQLLAAHGLALALETTQDFRIRKALIHALKDATEL